MVQGAFTATDQHSDTHLPSSFRETLKNKHWCSAIDREYKTLRSRGTWFYVKKEPWINFLRYTWDFRGKPQNKTGHELYLKARCNIRGDYQAASIEYDSIRNICSSCLTRVHSNHPIPCRRTTAHRRRRECIQYVSLLSYFIARYTWSSQPIPLAKKNILEWSTNLKGPSTVSIKTVAYGFLLA